MNYSWFLEEEMSSQAFAYFQLYLSLGDRRLSDMLIKVKEINYLVHKDFWSLVIFESFWKLLEISLRFERNKSAGVWEWSRNWSLDFYIFNSIILISFNISLKYYFNFYYQISINFFELHNSQNIRINWIY